MLYNGLIVGRLILGPHPQGIKPRFTTGESDNKLVNQWEHQSLPQAALQVRSAPNQMLKLSEKENSKPLKEAFITGNAELMCKN